jgi:hypothetical protein
MATSRTLKLSLLADVSNLSKSLKTADNDVGGFTNKLTDFSKKAGQAFALAGAAAAAFAGKVAIDAIKAASDLGETISKVGVLFGESSKEIELFADGAAQALGQTKQQALDAAANFAIFGSSAGLAGEDLVKFSTDFVSLAGDLASFNNVSQDDAINAIGSALRGEAEPLRRFGVLLDAATLEAAAFSLGIYDGSGALTAQQKVLAAQKVIFEQTTAAQGDFARTSDGLANQTKILTAELENTKLIIGEALLPIVLDLATAFATKIVPLIKQFAKGLSGRDGLNEGLTETERTAFIWGKRINSLIKTVVSFKSEIITLGITLATVFAVSAIASYVTAVVAGITTLIKAYNLLKTSAIVAGVASAFALNPLLGVGAAAGAASVLSLAAYQANKFNTRTPGGSSDLTGMESTGLSAGLYGSTPALGSASQIANSQAAVAGATSGLTSSMGTGGTGGTTKTPKVSAPRFVTPVGLPALDPALLNYQDSFRTSSMNTYNVTVNGALDSESTARQIVNIINDSQARGTLGAGAFTGAVGF